MTPTERAAAIAAVLSDPAALWAVQKSGATVCGPWVKAEAKGVSVHGGFWRCTPSGQDLTQVHPWWPHCDGVREPNRWEYGLDEEDMYEAALASHEKALARRAGRGWVWKVPGWMGSRKTDYASSREEAQSLADAELRRRGVLLLDTLADDTAKEGT